MKHSSTLIREVVYSWMAVDPVSPMSGRGLAIHPNTGPIQQHVIDDNPGQSGGEARRWRPAR